MPVLLLAVEVPEWALGTLVTITLAALGLAVKYGMAGGDAEATKKHVASELVKHDAGIAALAKKIDEGIAAVAEEQRDGFDRISSEHRESMTQVSSALVEIREWLHGIHTRVTVIETVADISPPDPPRPRPVRRDTPVGLRRDDVPQAPPPLRRK